MQPIPQGDPSAVPTEENRAHRAVSRVIRACSGRFAMRSTHNALLFADHLPPHLPSRQYGFTYMMGRGLGTQQSGKQPAVFLHIGLQPCQSRELGPRFRT